MKYYKFSSISDGKLEVQGYGMYSDFENVKPEKNEIAENISAKEYAEYREEHLRQIIIRIKEKKDHILDLPVRYYNFFHRNMTAEQKEDYYIEALDYFLSINENLFYEFISKNNKKQDY